MNKNVKKITNLALGAALGLVLMKAPTSALPEGPQVVHGSATVTTTGQSMNIHQATQRAIINWNGFSIGSGELVRFLQPSQLAAVLNRVQGLDASVINGILEGNGTVMLINPNGVLIGPGGAVNTGSFLASTLNVSDADFVSGRMDFEQDRSRELASIVNQGRIEVSDGGFVVLTSPSISNEGLILAQAGSIDIGAGTKATVSFDGRQLVNFGVDMQGDGTLLLSQQQAQDVLAQVVNNDGVQEAGTLSNSGTIAGDRILLQATGNLDLPGETRGENIVAQTDGDANLGSHFALDGASIDIDAGGSITFDALVAEGVEGVGGVVDLSAGNSILANEGAIGVAGDQVILNAAGGNISTPVAADTVTASAPNGSVSLAIAPGQIENTIIGERGTSLSVSAGADVAVTSVNTLYIGQVSGRQVSLASSTGSVVDAGDGNSGDNRDIIASQNAFLSAGEFIGTVDNPLEVDVNGDLTVLARGQVDGTSGVLTGFVGGEFIQDSETAGLVVLNFRNFRGSGIQQALRGVMENGNTLTDDSELGGASVPSLFFVYLAGSTDEAAWLDLLRGSLVWEDEDDEEVDEADRL
jgi:filamentous hemagglutinin family protein